jgi:hypothetical protein
MHHTELQPMEIAMSCRFRRDEECTSDLGRRILRVAVAAALIGCAAFAATAEAQRYPGAGGQGRSGNRNSPEGNDPAATARRGAATAPALSEPAVGIERELASLRTDLLLDASQTAAWMPFERAVRDAAQAARARQRRAFEQRQSLMIGGVDLPPGAGTSALQELIDDERQRAELLGQVLAALTALGGALDSRQSSMINRRIVQALRDPLGTN